MESGALKLFHKYFVYSTPFAFVVMLDGQAWPHTIPIGVIGDGLFSTVTGFLFLIWLASLLVFLIRLVVSADYRDSCFVNLVGIRERDEREELIVGRAAKSSFLFILSILLILFFISTWRYGERPVEGAGKASFTIGHLDLAEPSLTKDAESGTVYYPIPASKTSLLVFVIGLQIVTFRYFYRKAEKNI